MMLQKITLILGIVLFAIAILLWTNRALTSGYAAPSPQTSNEQEKFGGSTFKEPTSPLPAKEVNYASHVARLKKTVPDGFTIVVEKPFVVIGDESARKVNGWAKGTIRWSVDRIKKAYFRKDPDKIIDIWLFKNKASYEENTLELFGRKPTTPYGYYSPDDQALVMNISTGGGTLVHEIVHPFIESNFPECPSWFNEGLASLYEQSSDKNGEIVGLTNWRLRGLQFAIKDDLLGSFERLMSTDDRGFYEGDATNYAQARYLCYWLQERGLLLKFYHQFVKNAELDPTGIATLKAILKTDDLAAFQNDWETFVLKLRYP